MNAQRIERHDRIQTRLLNITSRIIDLAVPTMVNSIYVDESNDGLPTGFVDFSGHVQSVRVKVYPNGWDTDQKAETWEAYFEELGDKICLKYNNIIAELDRFVEIRREGMKGEAK